MLVGQDRLFVQYHCDLFCSFADGGGSVSAYFFSLISPIDFHIRFRLIPDDLADRLPPPPPPSIPSSFPATVGYGIPPPPYPGFPSTPFPQYPQHSMMGQTCQPPCFPAPTPSSFGEYSSFF